MERARMEPARITVRTADREAEVSGDTTEAMGTMEVTAAIENRKRNSGGIIDSSGFLFYYRKVLSKKQKNFGQHVTEASV